MKAKMNYLWPCLLAISFWLHFVAYNYPEFTLLENKFIILTLPCIALPLMVLFINLFMNWIFDPPRLAYSLTLLIVLFIFSYGHVKELSISDFSGIRHRELMPIMLLLFFAASALLIKAKKRIREIHLALTGLSLTFFLGSIVSLSYQSIKMFRQEKSTSRRIAKKIELNHQVEKPDIYYFIPDQYLNAKVLRESFFYNNSEFINKLRDRGFLVNEASYSNYTSTKTSLGATFNLDYLTKFPEYRESTDDVIPLVTNNRVFEIFNQLGYSVYSVAQNKPFTRMLNATNIGPNYYINTFLDTFLRTTPFSLISRNFFGHRKIRLTLDRIRKNVINTFENMKNVVSRPGPKFVMGYVQSPHGPLIFGRNGEPFEQVGELASPNPKEWIKPQIKKIFVNQLIYVSKLILDMVDHILTHSKTPPIIIIEADHGLTLVTTKEKQNPTNSVLRESFSAQSAYYVPDSIRKKISHRHSPVNTFRLLFSELYGLDFPLLEDRIYYLIPGDDKNFHDVTERLYQEVS